MRTFPFAAPAHHGSPGGDWSSTSSKLIQGWAHVKDPQFRIMRGIGEAETNIVQGRKGPTIWCPGKPFLEGGKAIEDPVIRREEPDGSDSRYLPAEGEPPVVGRPGENMGPNDAFQHLSRLQAPAVHDEEAPRPVESRESTLPRSGRHTEKGDSFPVR